MRRGWAWLMDGGWPWVAVALGPLALFGPMLVRGEALFWGTPLLQFVPWRQFALQLVREGHLPLWNPLLGTGAPLLANHQSALLYPPNWLLAVTGVAYGHGVLVLLHLLLAAWGMVALTRAWGIEPVGQALGGLSFSLSGYLVARAGFLSINAAVAWFPWLVLAGERLAQAAVQNIGVRRWVLCLGSLVALQWLAGHAQMAWYTAVFVAVWSLVQAWHLDGLHGARRALLALGLGALVGFSLAAAQLLPTLEYLQVSYRADTLDPTFALTYSFWPWRLLGLLMPDLFGNPARGDYWGYGNYWEDAIYIGVLPFLLAVRALVRRPGGEAGRRRVRWLSILGLATSVLALGANTPVFPFLFYHVPTFDLFQAPTRWNLILVFALSALAAIGAQGWQRPEGRGLYWTRLGTAGAGMIGFAAVLGATLLPGVHSTFVRAFAVASVWLFLAGAFTVARPSRWSPRWQAVLVTLVLADLVVAGWGLNPSVPLSVYQGRSQLAARLGKGHRLYMPASLEYELKFERTHRFDTFHPGVDWRLVREMGLPNTTMLDGLPSANNFDPLLPDRYVRWLAYLEEAEPMTRAKLLALMDVGWEATADPSTPTGVRYVRREGARRVRIVPQAVLVGDGDEALARFAEVDPGREVVLEAKAQWAGLRGGEGRARVWQGSNPNVVVVEASAPAGGWLVLSDLWYPGWRATVDGEPTPLFRADYLFRALWLPPGEHIVRFEYRPASFYAGLVLSLVGWATWAWLLWRGRRR